MEIRGGTWHEPATHQPACHRRIQRRREAESGYAHLRCGAARGAPMNDAVRVEACTTGLQRYGTNVLVRLLVR
eukprot:SAG25_NODE_13615_length_265_cov_0.620482_1_plen_72_part_01